jgi:hypothetical protein
MILHAHEESHTLVIFRIRPERKGVDVGDLMKVGVLGGIENEIATDKTETASH